MGQLTGAQYDVIERAIIDQTRLMVMRRGTEFLVIPLRLITAGRREAILARHPSTGASLTLFLDETERIEVVR